jgi:hypothetical protein
VNVIGANPRRRAGLRATRHAVAVIVLSRNSGGRHGHDTFAMRNVARLNTYWVILEVAPELQDGFGSLDRIYIKSPLTAQAVPLSVLVTLDKTRIGPLSISHQGQTDPLRSRPQRHPQLMRLLIGRADGSFQFACDHRRFSVLADEALEHANVFFCPRAELQGLLCHLRPLAILMLRISSNLSNIEKSTQRQST